jgi:hypothetical protein
MTNFYKKHYNELFPEITMPDPMIPAVAALSLIDKELMAWSNPGPSSLGNFILNKHSK